MTNQLDFAKVLLKFRAVVALVALLILFAAIAPDFLSLNNLTILLKHVAINAILALGMTFVILTSGIDLSVGSIAGFTGMIAGYLLHEGIEIQALGSVIYLNVWMTVLIAMMGAALIGALNGYLIAVLNIPPFIATLGTLYIARGFAMLISNGATFPRLDGDSELGNQGFLVLGGNGVLGVPAPILIMIGLAVIAWFLAEKTVFGRHVYAVGGNEDAAKLAGVKVRRVKFYVYVLSAICAGVVGLVIASQLASAHPATGETFELNAIAAVVLGGASLMGGRGRIAGALIGALVIGVLANGLVLMGVSAFWQMVIKGAVIVAAVYIDQKTRNQE